MLTNGDEIVMRNMSWSDKEVDTSFAIKVEGVQDLRLNMRLPII